MHKVIIYPGEDKSWVAESPAYPEFVSKGRTKPAARAKLRKAIEKFEKYLKSVESNPKFIAMMKRSDEDIRAGRVFTQVEVERRVRERKKGR